jgi:hypothetical protein
MTFDANYTSFCGASESAARQRLLVNVMEAWKVAD